MAPNLPHPDYFAASSHFANWFRSSSDNEGKSPRHTLIEKGEVNIGEDKKLRMFSMAHKFKIEGRLYIFRITMEAYEKDHPFSKQAQ